MIVPDTPRASQSSTQANSLPPSPVEPNLHQPLPGSTPKQQKLQERKLLVTDVEQTALFALSRLSPIPLIRRTSSPPRSTSPSALKLQPRILEPIDIAIDLVPPSPSSDGDLQLQPVASQRQKTPSDVPSSPFTRFTPQSQHTPFVNRSTAVPNSIESANSNPIAPLSQKTPQAQPAIIVANHAAIVIDSDDSGDEGLRPKRARVEFSPVANRADTCHASQAPSQSSVIELLTGSEPSQKLTNVYRFLQPGIYNISLT